MRKSIAVIGQGFVGGALTTVMCERGLSVYVYDKAGIRALNGKYPSEEAMSAMGNNVVMHDVPSKSISEFVTQCEIIPGFSGIYFVCVPTPMFEDGECDTSIVESVLCELVPKPNQLGTTIDRVVVIKSTIPPGSTEKWNKRFGETGLHIVFNPEFLTEANALDDMRNQNRIVLGGPRPWINRVKQVFETAFPKVPIIKTSSTTSEMVKYVTNVHLAVKVLLANEFYQICTALDNQGANIDYDKVIEYAQHDERLGNSHWKVPGPMPLDDGSNSPAFGVGGSCFPKDLNGLIALAKQLGVDPKIMSAAWEKNLEVRPQRDYLNLVGRAVSKKL